jgi:hypothetical protein
VDIRPAGDVTARQALNELRVAEYFSFGHRQAATNLLPLQNIGPFRRCAGAKGARP